MLNLQKGENLILDLNKKGISNINIGLGWDTECDLDVHAVLKDENNNVLGKVDFVNLEKYGVELSGDNLTGEGSGDDEILYINKNKIDSRVKKIDVLVNVFSEDETFADVRGAYIRLYEPENEFVHAKGILDSSDYSEYKTVHFASIRIDNEIDFKVIMKGSYKDIYDIMYEMENGNSCEIAEGTKNSMEDNLEEARNARDTDGKPKRKKLFGIF